MKRVDLTNLTFNKLHVISYAYTKNKKAYWRCLCDCGIIKNIQGNSLKNKDTTSCGCVHREKHTKHNLASNIYYGMWNAMIQRCNNSNHKAYKRYGGRGIQICEEWRDVKNFIKWMKLQEPIRKNYTLDRIDNNGNYSPENCKLSSSIDQASNRVSNRIIEINGEQLILRDAISKYGKVNANTILARIYNLKWDPIRAVIAPKYIGNN